MLAVTAAVAAAAGAVAGRGLRAVAFRYAVPAGQPPRRECPGCGATVPRAWLPPGRCGGCRRWLPPRAGSVEAATAVLIGLIAVRVHPWPTEAAACWLALCAVPLAFTDVMVRRLPDVLTIPAWAGALGILLAAAAAGGHWGQAARAAAGGAVALGALGLMRLVAGRLGPGGGDVKLAASLGTLLAWAGWQDLADGLIAGLVLFALTGTVLLAARVVSRGQRMPLGPFLIGGAFLVFLLTA
jgi:leader peptidase (prepilin peptidase) / N-methyltransferase